MVTRERRAHDTDVLLPWQMRRAAWQQISLNLPRAAYETGKEEGVV